MPFKSEAQRRFMWANHPEMAKHWEEATPKDKKLPEHVGKEAAVFAVKRAALSPRAGNAIMGGLTGASAGLLLTGLGHRLGSGLGDLLDDRPNWEQAMLPLPHPYLGKMLLGGALLGGLGGAGLGYKMPLSRIQRLERMVQNLNETEKKITPYKNLTQGQMVLGPASWFDKDAACHAEARLKLNNRKFHKAQDTSAGEGKAVSLGETAAKHADLATLSLTAVPPGARPIMHQGQLIGYINNNDPALNDPRFQRMIDALHIQSLGNVHTPSSSMLSIK